VLRTSLGAQTTRLLALMTSLVVPKLCLRAPGSASHKPGSVWEHQRQAWECLKPPATCLEAPRIDVEQSGKNILIGNAAGAPRNHSYGVIIQRFSKIEYSVSILIYGLIYLCISIATHPHTVYQDRMQAVLESNMRCA